MKWDSLLRQVGAEGVFETGLLLAGDVDRHDVHRQLSRWTKQGRLVQLRRGLYVLSSAYRPQRTHPFVLANRLHQGSYVSLQSALAFYGMIPEGVMVVTSVGTKRPARYDTEIGAFIYRHVQKRMFFAYERMEVSRGEYAFVACREKALLDLIYLTPHADQPNYLRELRLQNLPEIDSQKLEELVEQSGSAKLTRALRILGELKHQENVEYEFL